MFQELIFITAAACQSGQYPKAIAEPVKVKTYEVIEAPSQPVFMVLEPRRVRRNLVPNLFGKRDRLVYLVPVDSGACSKAGCR